MRMKTCNIPHIGDWRYHGLAVEYSVDYWEVGPRLHNYNNQQKLLPKVGLE